MVFTGPPCGARHRPAPPEGETSNAHDYRTPVTPRGYVATARRFASRRRRLRAERARQPRADLGPRALDIGDRRRSLGGDGLDAVVDLVLAPVADGRRYALAQLHRCLLPRPRPPPAQLPA